MLSLSSPINTARTLLAIEKRKCELSLTEFMKASWHIIEPGKPYIHNWHADFIAAHLEAITDGIKISDKPYNRLLINIPPGMSKSLMTSVFWPAWEWGPKQMPYLRSICASHSQDLAIRDSMRMRRLITSEWYQSHWPHVQLQGDQNAKTKFENTSSGFRQAVASGSITGARGDRVIIDDPHSVDSANSDAQRTSTNLWFREAVPTRLDNPISSAIVVIMQRLHEDDISGLILSEEFDYDHIMLPMRYDPIRTTPTKLGYEDPRTEPGELLFEERFPLSVVERDERSLGSYATAGQFQQEPKPRGGGIIKDAWWQLWDRTEYPPVEFVIAALDTAYTAKTENDPSAMTVWGVWSGSTHSTTRTRMVDRYGQPIEMPVNNSNSSDSPKTILMAAWNEHLELHDLVKKVVETCRKMKVDMLLIENKAAGHSVAQELRRLFSYEDFSVRMWDPKTIDKVARLYSVQHLFEEGMVYAPDKDWAEMVIQQVSVFPKGKHDDLVDATSMPLKQLRDMGLLTRSPERLYDIEQSMRFLSDGQRPLYVS
jgi:predicted phage terminase large subunit-like protein